MCASRKYLYPPYEGVLEILRDGRYLKHLTFYGKQNKAKQEFPEEFRGRFKPKLFSGAPQCKI